MKVYNYDMVTKEYTGENVAYRDPVSSRRAGKDVYIYPAYTTEIEPPKTKDGEVAVFENGAWVIKKDYRGQTVYNLDTREAVIWQELGNIPKEYAFKLPERLEDLKTQYLQIMKTNFDVYLTRNKVIIPSFELYFTYKSVERLKQEQLTNVTMSRDDNNKIYMLTKQEYDAIINYLAVYGQYLYLQKWTIESVLKKCTDIEILKTYKDKLDFKVDSKLIQNLVSLAPDKRKDYFKQMASNIK